MSSAIEAAVDALADELAAAAAAASTPSSTLASTALLHRGVDGGVDAFDVPSSVAPSAKLRAAAVSVLSRGVPLAPGRWRKVKIKSNTEEEKVETKRIVCTRFLPPSTTLAFFLFFLLRLCEVQREFLFVSCRA